MKLRWQIRAGCLFIRFKCHMKYLVIDTKIYFRKFTGSNCYSDINISFVNLKKMSEKFKTSVMQEIIIIIHTTQFLHLLNISNFSGNVYNNK